MCTSSNLIQNTCSRILHILEQCRKNCLLTQVNKILEGNEKIKLFDMLLKALKPQFVDTALRLSMKAHQEAAEFTFN